MVALAFAFLIDSRAELGAALLLADSIWTFGGRFGDSPIVALVSAEASIPYKTARGLAAVDAALLAAAMRRYQRSRLV